jgi:hypothetical protein
MGAGAGSSPPERRNSNQAKAKAYLWFQRNGSKLVATDIICIVLLFILYLFPSRLPLFIDENVNGIVPGVICVLGIVLIHNSVILPYYSEPQPGEASFGEVKFTWTLYTPTAVSIGAGLNFFLGVSMITFSIIMAYRPSLLFTRNRPDSVDSEWLKYPLWQDNTVLADGRTEYSVPIKKLMTDQDRYILWRYEYILANIYGIPHLVRPEGYVPKYSTSIQRDRESGQMIGKARYMGFFI